MRAYRKVTTLGHDISFTRLSEIQPDEILAHMSDPLVAEHMPLLTFKWDRAAVSNFVAAKEEYWNRDGLGHWAILSNKQYIAWGGFQREGDEWDYGLVLKREAFGLGTRIFKKAIEFAIADDRIPFVTFLLSPSPRNLRALERFGVRFINETEYEGTKVLKYRLETC